MQLLSTTSQYWRNFVRGHTVYKASYVASCSDRALVRCADTMGSLDAQAYSQVGQNTKLEVIEEQGEAPACGTCCHRGRARC